MQGIDRLEFDDVPSERPTLDKPLPTVGQYLTPGDAVRMPIEHALTPRVARIALVLSDLMAIGLGYLVAFAVQSVFRPVPGFVRADHVTLSLLSLPVWLIALVATKSYVARHVDRATQEFSCILRSTRIVVGTIIVASFLSQFDTLSRLWVVVMVAAVTGMLLVERGIARLIFHRMRVQGKMTRRVLIAGTGTDAISLLHSIKGDRSLGYDVVGFVGEEDIGEREGCRVLGGYDEVMNVVRQTNASGVIVSVASLDPTVVNRLTRELTDAAVHVALSSSLYDIDVTRFRPQTLGGRTLFYVERTVRNGWRAIAKRTFDIVVASGGLLLTSPIVAVSAILIKRGSSGPFMFRQERIGLNGQTFTILKLRTMCNDAEQLKDTLRDRNEADGPLFKIESDPRITGIGRILRKLSIDEIPQLWNVLKGEMSLVGPRPALPDEIAHWKPELHERLRVPPGITGMWQVHGRSSTSFDDYARLDLYYVDNWSLTKDLGIMARTFLAVAQSTGAS
jgi:exopolysaccharide biosynthesis polyprenyl glycosylphosphotransferase